MQQQLAGGPGRVARPDGGQGLQGGYGVGTFAATTALDTSRILLVQIGSYGALFRSGVRRYATYRQATVAGAVTNTVFGFCAAT